MTTDGQKTSPAALTRPTDPYDVAAWHAFYEAHPGLRRAAGAEVTNEPGEVTNPDGGTGTPPAQEPTEPTEKKPAESNKPTDKEAELLKDVMKHKERAKKAEADLAAVQSKLKEFEGLDVAEIRNLLEEKSKAEETAALARGEFDKVKAKMLEQHNATLKEKESAIQARDAENAKLLQRIDDLTVGTSFGQSKFVREETVLSPAKARQLYGAHFDIVEGQIVGYDKPRGVEGRSPIVDAAGDPVGFEDALKRVIEADPDKDTLVRSNLKPGADSSPTKKAPDAKPDAKLSGMEKIKAGLAKRAGN